MSDSIDKYFYDNTNFLKEASDEYEDGNIDETLNLKSQIEANGDDKIAKLKYIDMRATALAKEAAEKKQKSKTLKNEDLLIDVDPAVREVLKRCPITNGQSYKGRFADGSEFDLSNIALEQRIEIINNFIRHPTYLKSAVNPSSQKDFTYLGSPYDSGRRWDRCHPIEVRMKHISKELKINNRVLRVYLTKIGLIVDDDFYPHDTAELERRIRIAHTSEYEKEFPWIPILREKNDPMDVEYEDPDEEEKLWSSTRPIRYLLGICLLLLFVFFILTK